MQIPCDLIIATPTLLGTQNPELFGLVNKVLRVVLWWDPLHGLRLAKIEGEKSEVKNNAVSESTYT